MGLGEDGGGGDGERVMDARLYINCMLRRGAKRLFIAPK